jgi:translation initiation factor IF-2
MTNNTQQLVERPPIVVVMGHVDHGKSTLLDFIRKSNIVAGEAGGITQHVAAYEVEHEGEADIKRITFIDTPGHAAFKAIRARGANIADIAILVVSADDGVKAQTLEALESIKESGIPFVVAINKIDKPNASIERTQASLMEHAIYLEKLGGDVPWAAISAKAGTGVNELLDTVLLLAEIQDFKANPAVCAEGFVVEAHRDQKRGIAATLIITEGTISSGMFVVAGDALAPVRIMESHMGRTLKQASFSTPIALVGFDKLPAVGEKFHTFKNKKEAEAAVEAHQAKAITKVNARAQTSDRFMLPLIVRADTTGSLEAIQHELKKLGDERMGVAMMQSGVGNIGENDVKAALSAEIPVLLVGFNVGTDTPAGNLARERGVTIEHFSIIYKLTERAEELMKQLAPKQIIEEKQGAARIIKQFSSRHNEHVVGGAVTEGHIAKGAEVNVLRRGVKIGVGKIKSLQSSRQNVERVGAPDEFGTQIESVFEIAAGDTLEYITKVTK